MPRIVFCVTNDLSFDQRMHRICRSLSAAGYEVTLVGRALKNSPQLRSEPFGQIRLNCFFNKGKPFYIEFNVRLFLWLMKQSFDAVCAIDLDTALPAIFSAKLKKKKLLYDGHEYFPEVPEVVARPITRFIWKIVERLTFRFVDVAYTVSDSIAKAFEREYGRKVSVVRNIAVLKPANDVKQEESVLLYQGALNEGRGLEQLIEVARQAAIEVWIAGDGDIGEQLKKCVSQFQIQHKVKFFGKLTPDELSLLTPKAFIGFNVLEPRGKSYLYSLSNKTFDYIHAGVPQLMSDFPEMRAFNEEYEIGIIVKECSATEIHKAINILLHNRNLYEQLRANCISVRQLLNWQSEEKKLLSIYEQVFR